MLITLQFSTIHDRELLKLNILLSLRERIEVRGFNQPPSPNKSFNLLRPD
jgi:hypothetical protein